MSSEMVERVARAIHSKRNNPDDGKHWFHDDAEKCDLSRQLAIAAIEAMRDLPRDPLMAGYEAAVRCGGAIDTTDVISVWQAAIDAALTLEGTEP